MRLLPSSILSIYICATAVAANYIVASDTPLAVVVSSIQAIAPSYKLPVVDKYELEDDVLRGGGFARVISKQDSAALHAAVDAALAAKAVADDAVAAAAAQNLIDHPPSKTPTLDMLAAELGVSPSDLIKKLTAP